MQKYGKIATLGIGIIMIVATFAILSITANAETPPKKVWVDDDFDSSTDGWGITHFDKIQDGVDAVDSGGNVHVYVGTYYENIVIEKNLKLIGEKPDTTIIQGEGSGNGIESKGISGITIANVLVKNFEYGIYLYDSGFSKINANKVMNCMETGIYLEHSGSSKLTANTVTGNVKMGIYLLFSGSSILNKNSVKDNGHYGIVMSSSGSSYVTGNTVKGSYYDGIFFYKSTWSTISGNIVSGIYHKGITLSHSGYSDIIGNTLKDNGNGIELYNHGSVGEEKGPHKVTENTFKENTIGIRITSSFNNLFYYNNIIDNSYPLAGSGQPYTLNTWDDGAGMGNYWSDYDGEDTNDDGIGDTDLPHLGVDYYPMMNEY